MTNRIHEYLEEIDADAARREFMFVSIGIEEAILHRDGTVCWIRIAGFWHQVLGIDILPEQLPGVEMLPEFPMCGEIGDDFVDYLRKWFGEA